MSEFWNRVVEELEYKGINRAELARRCDFSVTNIGQGIKLGSTPSADTAVKIAEVLGVSVEYLVNGTSSSSAAKNSQSTQEELRLSRKYRKLLEQCETLSPQKTELLSLIADNLEKK